EHTETVEWYRYVGEQLSPKVFNGRLASIRLCDDWFQPRETLAIVDVSKWKRLCDSALALQKEGRLEEAERKFRAVLEIAEKFGDQDQRLIYSLNGHGNAALRLEKYDAAESSLKRAVQLARQALGQTSPEFGYSSDALGIVCGEQKRYDEAEKYFRQALAAH